MSYTLIDWGLSMYGGYYANILEEENSPSAEAWTSDIFYISSDTLAGLRGELSRYGLKADHSRRFDN